MKYYHPKDSNGNSISFIASESHVVDNSGKPLSTKLSEITSKLNNVVDIDTFNKNSSNILNQIYTFVPEVIYKAGNVPITIYTKNLTSYPDSVFLTSSNARSFGNPNVRDCITLNSSNTNSTYNINFEYRLKTNDQTPIKPFSLKVKNCNSSARNGETVRALFIGDNSIGNGIVTDELINLFKTDSVNFSVVGTRTTVKEGYTCVNTSTNKHEGYNEWQAAHFVEEAQVNSVTNPFYNPSKSSFDFSYYVNKYLTSSTRPNYVFLYIGVSDIHRVPFDIKKYIERMNVIVNSIKAYDSSIKICISYILSGYKGPYKRGEDFGGESDIIKARMINEALCDTYSNRTSENIYLVPVLTYVDEENGYELMNIPTSQSRMPESDFIPMIQGHNILKEWAYKQMADAYYSFIKCH